MYQKESRDRESKVIRMGGEKPLTAEEILRREQLAAQIVAIMQAHFSRPEPEEMLVILRCAELQISPLLPQDQHPLSSG
jgi:hypothetical protein